jgi:hypothetical protein
MAIAYYIRVHFQESPIFEEIKAKGAMTAICASLISVCSFARWRLFC